MQLLSQLDFREVHPLVLIRAINHLRSLGHADAIEALNRYAASTKYSFNLNVVVPHLFVPNIAGEKLPQRDSDGAIDSYILDLNEWRVHVEIHDGIPFAINDLRYVGSFHEQTFLIAWAKERARLRDDDLIPTDNPFSTADRLVRQWVPVEVARAKGISDERRAELALLNTSLIRQHAFELVKHLVPSLERPEYNDWASDDKDWRLLESLCLRRGLRWDSVRMEYKFTK